MSSAADLAVPEAVVARARRVRFVLMDVDGVLTDGRIYAFSDGAEGRAFSVRDGHGIRLAQRAGLRLGILSGRRCAAVEARARELAIEEVHQGVLDKLRRYEDIARRLGLADEAVCYIGDDLVDAPVLRRVGLAVAPADADARVRGWAHWVTRCPGGAGAVRETLELLLQAQGHWERVAAQYLGHDAPPEE